MISLRLWPKIHSAKWLILYPLDLRNSLLPIGSKVLEKHLCELFHISDQQLGFQAGKSSTMPSYQNEWFIHLEKCKLSSVTSRRHSVVSLIVSWLRNPTIWKSPVIWSDGFLVIYTTKYNMSVLRGGSHLQLVTSGKPQGFVWDFCCSWLCLGAHAQTRAYGSLVVCVSVCLPVTGISVPWWKSSPSICFYVVIIILSWI